MKLDDLVRQLGGELHCAAGDRATELTGVGPIEASRQGQVTFLTTGSYRKYAATTQASAIIVKEPLSDVGIPQIVHSNPYYAFAQTAQIFNQPVHSYGGQSERASIDPSAQVASSATVYPHAFIGPRAVIGDDAVLYPGVYVGADAKIGARTVMYPNSVLGDRCTIGEGGIIHGGSVIGGDGFGFAPGKENYAKIPQVGLVEMGDDVEIGALCTVDRATMGKTSIGNGSKLDSHVHVGHNVTIGEHTLLCGGVCIAGSATLQNWCVVGGGASVSNHTVMGDGIRIGAKAGVTKNLSEAGEYMGFPAIPADKWRMEIVHIRRLEKTFEKIKELEAKISDLENNS